MRLNHINIENFRSFKSCSITFARKTTVLIGKNGTGKSNLISALKKGLSFMFAKDEKYTRSLSDSNGCVVRNFSLCWDTHFEDRYKGFSLPVKIDYNATFNHQEINWSLLKKTESARFPKSGYEEALQSILSHYNTNDNAAQMPVLAFFSDAFPHNFTKIAPQFDKIVHRNIIPRDLAYYDWDNITNCSELWQNRYIKVFYELHELKFEQEDLEEKLAQTSMDDTQERFMLEQRLESLKQTPYWKSFIEEQEFIDQRIIRFTAALKSSFDFINKDFSIQRILVNKPDKKTFLIGFDFKNGKQMYFNNLPQGYNRLLSMVFDIAYRSYILNENKEPTGIVFIDEIELHLHPSLQQEVLERFRITFPEIQFIVSTHSPLVISNLSNIDGINNKIIKLKSDGINYTNEPIENDIYGIDYTTSLMDIMDADHRSVTVENLIDTYVILKHLNKEEDAQRIKNEIDAIVGKNNMHIEAEINAKLEDNK